MRIVAGAWRGRHIIAPDDGVRPTSDRVREAWMSIVHPFLAGARVLDLFAGSGALGLEALSRGATSAVFVDDAAPSLVAVTANAKSLGASDRTTIQRADALTFLGGLTDDRFDVAFADPPYAKQLATQVAKRWIERPFATILGVEHHRDERLPDGQDRRRYGDTAITFYRIETPQPDPAIITTDSITGPRT